MEEKILVFKDGKREIEYFSELDQLGLTISALPNVVRDDPGTFEVLLRTARAGGYSYDELISKIGDIEEVNKGLDKLLDVGILTVAWKLNEEGIYERVFIMRSEIAKLFKEFSDIDNIDILDYREKLHKRFFLTDLG